MANRQTSGVIFMLDNYDSFTYNLVHYLEQLDLSVIVQRNDQTSLATIESIHPSHVIISPGPCNPDKAGLSLDVVRHFKNKIPILGVCLGHQAIAQAFGAKIVKAKQVVHGKTSFIHHNNQGIFQHLPKTFNATRYHSLVIAQNSLPECLQITAWTSDRNGELEEIMGIQHKNLPIHGVQFHPESVLSEHGLQLLQQFCKS